MTEKFKQQVSQIEKETKRWYGFIVRCDDVRRPKEIDHDMSFKLWETDKLSDVLDILKSNDLNYDLVVQDFYESNDSVESEISIVSNNHLNNRP